MGRMLMVKEDGRGRYSVAFVARLIDDLDDYGQDEADGAACRAMAVALAARRGHS
jgi:hypothetical protein